MRRMFVTLCMTTLGILITFSGVLADSIKVLDASGGPGGVVKLKFDVPGSTESSLGAHGCRGIYTSIQGWGSQRSQ